MEGVNEDVVGECEDDEVKHLIIAESIIIDFECFLTEGHWKIIHDEASVQVLLDNAQPVLEVHQRE